MKRRDFFKAAAGGAAIAAFGSAVMPYEGQRKGDHGLIKLDSIKDLASGTHRVAFTCYCRKHWMTGPHREHYIRLCRARVERELGSDCLIDMGSAIHWEPDSRSPYAHVAAFGTVIHVGGAFWEHAKSLGIRSTTDDRLIAMRRAWDAGNAVTEDNIKSLI